ncbi:MAG: hypothetical protein K6D59_01655 [Bacteroidales bacterium]|nr:hypothetical protein [Bacteroidales bacterium]
MKVIFFDFDGVMDTIEYCQLLECMGKPINGRHGIIFNPHCVCNLKRIVDETGAVIVVSSSWKYMMSLSDILEMWRDRDLPGFVTGITPFHQMCRNRGDEIDAWLRECKTECEYVIIDDMDERDFNRHQLDRLVVTSPYDGLNDDVADRVINILNNN